MKNNFTKFLVVEGPLRQKDHYIFWEKQSYGGEEDYKDYIGKFYRVSSIIAGDLMIELENYYPPKSAEEAREVIVSVLKKEGITKTDAEIEKNVLANVKASTSLWLKIGYNIRRSDVKGAKLFMCSRDIHVGDKYFAIDGEEHTAKHNYEFLPHDYKVIGEVSKEATYVKAGEEFDDEEIIRFHQPGGADSETWNLINLDKHPSCDHPGAYVLVKVLGPCGHFH